MGDEDRLYWYAERHFQRHNGKNMAPWPTVRKASKALRWSQAKVVEVIEGCGTGDMFLSSYFVRPPDPIAEHFVETFRRSAP